MVKDAPNDLLGTGKQVTVHNLFQDLPKSFPKRYAALSTLRTAFQKELASSLEPVLNEYLQQKSPEGLQARRKITSWVDQITRDLGLVPSHQGKPALLIAVLGHPNDPTTDRFELIVHEPDDLFDRPIASRKIPPLSLIPAPTNYEKIFHSIRAACAPGRRR